MPFYGLPRVTLHKEYYTREYRIKCLSSGCLLRAAIIILVIVLPFITTYSTGGKQFISFIFCAVFWQRTAISIEKPNVQYKNKLFAQLLFIDQTTGAPKVFEYATVKSVQQAS